MVRNTKNRPARGGATQPSRRAPSNNFYKRGSTLSNTDLADALKQRQQAKKTAKIDLRHEERVQLRSRIIRIGAIVLLVVWFMSRQFLSGASVLLPEDESADVTQHTALELAANDYINGQSLGMFKPFFDESAMQEYLSEQTPLLGDVRVHTSLFSRVVRITPTFRSPVFIWEDQRHDKRFVIDNEGIIVGEGSEYTKNTDLVRLVDTSGFETEIGEAVLPASVSEFLADFTDLLKNQTKLSVDYLATTDSVKDYHVYLKGSSGSYFLKINSLRSAQEHIDDLVVVLAHLEKRNKQPSAYIDLRINDRIFYK